MLHVKKIEKQNGIIVCIVMIEIYCDDKNVLW